MSRKFKIYIISASVINGFVMLAIAWFMLKAPMVRADEKLLIKATSRAKEYLFTKDTLSHHDFMFINVAYNKELIEKNDASGFPLGNEAITDRKDLANLLGFLNNYKTHFKSVICDVYFIGNAPSDSALQSELIKLGNKVIIPYHKNRENPKFSVNMGLADYIATDGDFVKFKLVQKDDAGKSHKTIPLLLFEQMNNGHFVEGNWFDTFGNHRGFSNFILNIRITRNDLEQRQCPYDNLGPFNQLTDSMKLELINNRTIVIGDFENEKNDFHKSLAGDIPGALIITNVYLALLRGDQLLPWLLFPLLYLGFVLISLFVFYPVNVFEVKIARVTEKIPHSKLSEYLVGFISYATMLSLVSTLCYFWFNIHINVLYLTVYIFALEKAIAWVDKKWKLRMNYKPKNKD